MKPKPGPGQGERLKIDGDWQNALKRVANAPKPKAKPIKSKRRKPD